MPVPRLATRESEIILLQFPDILRLTSKQSQGLPSSDETSPHAAGLDLRGFPCEPRWSNLVYTGETDSGKEGSLPVVTWLIAQTRVFVIQARG